MAHRKITCPPNKGEALHRRSAFRLSHPAAAAPPGGPHVAPAGHRGVADAAGAGGGRAADAGGGAQAAGPDSG
eukprot:8413919-Pyramimonas_sp.AAC.1